jgi:hypothetical protein
MNEGLAPLLGMVTSQDYEGMDRFGIASPADIEALGKALTAGSGTDMAALTGGRALTVQSLEQTLMVTTLSAEDIVLFKRLKKFPVYAVVDEWTEKSERGERGRSFAGETDDGNETSSTYARKVGQVKFLSTLRKVSYAKSLEKSIVDVIAEEQVDGTLVILRDAEWALFEGEAAVVTEQFDGLKAIVGANADHVIDAQGAPLTQEMIAHAAEIIRRSFGVPTDLFLSTKAQTDLDMTLEPAYRVPLPDIPGGGVQLGSPVAGIRTSFGNVKTDPDLFVEEGGAPEGALTTDPTTPASVTAAASGSGNTLPAGDYYYRVSAVSRKGESTTVVLSGAVTVAAGEKVTLTITRGSATDTTGFYIYRSPKNGANTASGMRLVGKVAYSGAATTTWDDTGAWIPGTSCAYVLNMAEAYNAISWRQLLPMVKFPLYPATAPIIPWLQLLFGYLRVTKPKQHVLIKNVKPTQITWGP